MIFRLTHRLARKVKVGNLEEMAIDDDPLADWSCRLFIANRNPYIMISNTMSLYSCVIYGNGVTDRDLLVRKTLDAMGQCMQADNLHGSCQRFVIPGSTDVSFAKTINRSVTGSMSDHIHGSKLYLSDGLAPPEIGVRLNDTPLSALTGSDGRKYAAPRAVFVRLTESVSR